VIPTNSDKCDPTTTTPSITQDSVACQTYPEVKNQETQTPSPEERTALSIEVLEQAAAASGSDAKARLESAIGLRDQVADL